MPLDLGSVLSHLLIAELLNSEISILAIEMVKWLSTQNFDTFVQMYMPKMRIDLLVYTRYTVYVLSLTQQYAHYTVRHTDHAYALRSNAQCAWMCPFTDHESKVNLLTVGQFSMQNVLRCRFNWTVIKWWDETW